MVKQKEIDKLEKDEIGESSLDGLLVLNIIS